MGHLDGSEFDRRVVTHVNEPVIKVEELSYRYPNKTLALDGVSLEIAKGSRVALLGPNGAGKSTLFLHFNGILKPREGKVLFEGKEIKYGAKSLEELRAKVAIVLQNPDDQIFSATVEEDVAFGPMNLGLPMDEVEARVTEALDQVGLLDQRSKPTQQLSFGQRKRVSLAGAIAMRPEVLVMDEPTAGLDPRMVHELLELADELNHKGLTVIMSTHDVECAYSWADEVKVLEKGKMVYSGATPGFFSETGLVHRVGLTEPLLFEMNRSLSTVHGCPGGPPPPKHLRAGAEVPTGHRSTIWKTVRHAFGWVEPRAAEHFAKGDAPGPIRSARFEGQEGRLRQRSGRRGALRCSGEGPGRGLLRTRFRPHRRRSMA